MRKFLLLGVPLAVVLAALYFYFVLNWDYSSGERAGWVQKFSKKGWICKTWEGELAMVTMPGTASEKFFFTVWDDAVAERINKAMGRRVSLHYEERVGLPTSCFGETRHYVNNVTIVPEIPISPGVMVPVPSGAPQDAGPSATPGVPPSSTPLPAPPPAAAPAPSPSAAPATPTPSEPPATK